MSGATATLERRVSGGLPDHALMIYLPGRGEDRWGRTFEELRSMFRLQDDWDGLDAKAPSTALVASAIEIAEWYRGQGLPAPSRAVAAPDGAVLLEWQAGGCYADVEITHPYHARVMLMVTGRPTQHRTLSPSDFLPAAAGAASTR
jgi:hypothetical protein